MTELSIVIPAYNEEKRIEKTLRRFAEFFKKDEILVIVNGCSDDTLKIVKKVKKDYGNINYKNYVKGGKGRAVINGFKLAKGELIGFVDADLATSPEAFRDLVDNIGYHDGVIASRHVRGARVLSKAPFFKRIASRVFNLIVRGLFFMNYRDTQCGAKVFTKEDVRKVAPKMTEVDWAFDVELLYLMKKNKFKIREHPTVWKEARGSKFDLKRASSKMFSSIVKLRLRKFVNN